MCFPGIVLEFYYLLPLYPRLLLAIRKYSQPEHIRDGLNSDLNAACFCAVSLCPFRKSYLTSVHYRQVFLRKWLLKVLSCASFSRSRKDSLIPSPFWSWSSKAVYLGLCGPQDAVEVAADSPCLRYANTDLLSGLVYSFHRWKHRLCVVYWDLDAKCGQS